MMKNTKIFSVENIIAPLTLLVLTSCSDEFYEDVDALNERYNPAAQQVVETDNTIETNTETNLVVNELDQDNDFYSDQIEIQLGSDPLDPLSTPLDSDNDQIPDYLDAYPYDPLQAVKKIQVSQSNLDYDVIVEVLGVTKILSPDESIEFTVGNLEYSVNFTSSKFNEFTRCEQVEADNDFNLNYQCRAWIKYEVFNEGYPLTEQNINNKMNCNLDRYYPEVGVYADEIEYINCYGTFHADFLDNFSNLKYFIFFDYSDNKDETIRISQNPNLETIILIDLKSGVVEFDNCEQVKSIDIFNSKVNGVDLLNCKNLERFYFQGEMNYLLKGELDADLVSFVINDKLFNQQDFLGHNYLIFEDENTNTKTVTSTSIWIDTGTETEYETDIGTSIWTDEGISTSTVIETDISTAIWTDEGTSTSTGIGTSTDTGTSTSTITETDISTGTSTIIEVDSYPYYR